MKKKITKQTGLNEGFVFTDRLLPYDDLQDLLDSSHIHNNLEKLKEAMAENCTDFSDVKIYKIKVELFGTVDINIKPIK